MDLSQEALPLFSKRILFTIPGVNQNYQMDRIILRCSGLDITSWCKSIVYVYQSRTDRVDLRDTAAKVCGVALPN